jgi:hypothetical protein
LLNDVLRFLGAVGLHGMAWHLCERAWRAWRAWHVWRVRDGGCKTKAKAVYLVIYLDITRPIVARGSRIRVRCQEIDSAQASG